MAASSDDCGPNPDPPVLFLVIANISKRCNVRSLIESALAFGAEVLVGKQVRRRRRCQCFRWCFLFFLHEDFTMYVDYLLLL